MMIYVLPLTIATLLVSAWITIGALHQYDRDTLRWTPQKNIKQKNKIK